MSRRLFLALCASLFCSLLSAAEPPLVLGVAPHTSARVILEMYQPLRRHLETTLGKPVEVQTATDFNEFARRALNQDYDLLVTTGHQARMLQTDAAYLPLLTYQAEFRALVLVDRKSGIRDAQDLHASVILGLSPTSLVTLWGERWLRLQKINDVSMRYISAADSVSRLVLAGEATAAFTSLANFQKLPPDVRGNLRVLAQSDPMLGRVYMLNKRQAGQLNAIASALLHFAESSDGQTYFSQNKLEGYRRLRPHELEAMEPYAATTRALLGGGK